MGSLNEVNAPHRNDGDISASESKAESVNMDLYINPAAERKMMLKFDVSVQIFHPDPHVIYFAHTIRFAQLECSVHSIY